MATPEPMADSNAHWSDEVGRRAPNILTGLRLFAVPVFVFLLASPTPTKDLWATAIFLAASVTDWFDGYLARIYRAESILGKMLDPLADKILVTAALVMLAAVPGEPRVQAWIVVVFLSREFIVTGLRSIASLQGVLVPASRWAKHKTAWTFLAIVCLLIHSPYHVLGVFIDFHRAGTVFLWLALGFSLATGAHYAIALRRLFRDASDSELSDRSA
ncbi:MAG: CDP-diacylglycerol--glycerol-3-phosphate 3-phosphatidyltransferase [Bdellovibrionales bacterium]|nr:CDP-diacylglycerol--glycerol-3-phosphate 3-phosphatidyltransferase [Bdellovibrionales bacterium]